MIDIINVEKDHIQFGDTKVYPPFTREKVDAILGVPGIEEKDIELEKNRFSHLITYRWDSLGVYSSSSERTDHYDRFIVYLDTVDTGAWRVDSFFPGQVRIGGRDYTKASFQTDKLRLYHQKKIGRFEILTVLADRIDALDESLLEGCEWMTKEVEIVYCAPKAPRSKTSIYDLRPLDEPALRFESFPFKLMVMEELMYKRGLLSPRFDIYDFAKKNPKREIDIGKEGYKAIPEAKKWFRDYPIPERLASEITELIWDGGLAVFSQIYPFWDGEDDSFDVKKLSAEEVRQLPRLKKVYVGEGFSKKAADVLKEQGIFVEGHICES